MNDKKILFVDDEEFILKSIERALAKQPFNLVFAKNAEEGFKVLESMPVAIVVSDLMMPGMDGLTFLKKVRELYPNTVRIVLTAFVQVNQVLAAINSGEIFKYITKPFKLNEEFIPSLAEALKFWALNDRNRELMQKLALKNVDLEETVKKRTLELEKAKSLLENQMKVRSTFFKNISEEFRSKINHIETITKEALRLRTNREERLQQILNTTTNVSTYLDNIITLSPDEGEVINLQATEFQILDIITSISQTTKSLMDKKKFNFRATLNQKNLPPFIGDKSLILKMIMIVMEQALRISTEGTINFLTKATQKGIRFHLEFIINTSSNEVNTNKVQALFNEFKSMNVSEKQDKLLGMGLSTAKYLAQLMGGDFLLLKTESSGIIYQIFIELLAKH